MANDKLPTTAAADEKFDFIFKFIKSQRIKIPKVTWLYHEECMNSTLLMVVLPITSNLSFGFRIIFVV